MYTSFTKFVVAIVYDCNISGIDIFFEADCTAYFIFVRNGVCLHQQVTFDLVTTYELRSIWTARNHYWLRNSS